MFEIAGHQPAFRAPVRTLTICRNLVLSMET